MHIMSFDTDKKKYIAELQAQQHNNKKDKSRKGFIDAEVAELVQLINNQKDFYTTSSCAGRIIVFHVVTKRKCDNTWIYVSHEKVQKKQVLEAIQNYVQQSEKTSKKKEQNRNKGDIWLRYEPLILHVCTRTLSAAEQFLDAARKVGFKRGGIVNTKKRIMIEITGVDRLDAPIARDNRLLVDEKYLGFLVDEGNKKLAANLQRIERFKTAIINAANYYL